MSKIVMPPNKVLIKRVGRWDTMDGVIVGDDEMVEHKFLPNVGEVVAVCKRLRFNKGVVKWMKAHGKPRRKIEDLTQSSCLFLAHIEVKPGDMVLYRMSSNAPDAENIVSDTGDEALMIINHDSLIAKVFKDPEAIPYPLCGNVLITDDPDSTEAVVVAEGLPLIDYFDHSGLPDFPDKLFGRTVKINQKQAMPLGNSFSRSSGKGLAFIKRRYIHCYESQS